MGWHLWILEAWGLRCSMLEVGSPIGILPWMSVLIFLLWSGIGLSPARVRCLRARLGGRGIFPASQESSHVGSAGVGVARSGVFF